MPRITARLLPILTAAFVAGAILLPATPQPVDAREGSTFVSVVNRYRAEANVGPVSLHSVIDQISVERADQLARAQQLGHDMTYVKNRLAQAGICWERLGEIVAYNGRSADERIERFVYQWYHSDGHRKIMLGPDYTHAGGSYTTASNGYHYAAMIFVKLCGVSTTSPSTSSPTLKFTDIADSKFRNDILWIAAEGITSGCTATTYCPKGLVLRDQMATFLRRAMSLGGASKYYFSDIWGNKHADSINAAREAGLTSGCGGTKYCPTGRVTRGQMASFLARALNLPRASRDYFWDDNGSKHEDAINRVAQARITFGCDTGRYCPGGLVTREQMAAFLRRSFE
ncbi:hypothetical protein BH23CHL9_BH23CHL9_06510 [soil metagenome]